MASAPATVTVTVNVNQVPVAVASNSAPLTGPAPLAVAFSSAGSNDPDGTIASYTWAFGDGYGSSGANPSHTYTANGTYTAKLMVTDNLGAVSAQTSVTVTVTPPNSAPTAMASVTSTTGIAPLAVVFSSNGSSDTDGSIASYSWNFGDGTSSTEASPSHTYTTLGTFTATLVVTDNLGLASAPKTVTITTKSGPYVDISALTISKTTGSTGTYATVTATVKDHTGALKSSATVYGTWSGLVSGSTSGRTATNGTIALKSGITNGIGSITFTVTNIVLSGFSYDVTKNALSTISIEKPNTAPTVMASATPTTGYAPLAVVFSSSGSKDADGSIVSYSWDFGDGSTSTAASPSHTYTTLGTFSATLVLTDNLGAVSAPKTVTIATKPAPSVNISALTIIKTASRTGTYATATATVKDGTGALKSSATVYGTWSGLVSSSTSGKTATTGTIAFQSAATTLTGNLTFTVTKIVLSGYVYNASKDALNTVSIDVP